MIRCTRCGSGFSAFHSTDEISCPRCRVRDGVTSDFTTARSDGAASVQAVSLTEMTRRIERGRVHLGVSAQTSA
jgi:phage FluMu protein Com